MTNVLSQDEIDQLLAVINAVDAEAEDCTPAYRLPRRIKIYDFKRPDKFSKEQIRTVCIMHETFARLAATSLSAYLRSAVHVHVASVDQLTYEEFIRSIPTPTALAVIIMKPLKGNAILEIDPAITHIMINRLFGGKHDRFKEQHELTLLERKIMGDTIRECIFKPLRDAWKDIIELKPTLKNVDTMPQYVQIVPPQEMAVLICLECRIGEAEGMINLCIPTITIDPILHKLNAHYLFGIKKEECTMEDAALSNDILDTISIPVRVELGKRSFPLKTIRELGEGAIMELDKFAGEPVDIFADNVLIGHGEVVVIDERFGVRVVDMMGKENARTEAV